MKVLVIGANGTTPELFDVGLRDELMGQVNGSGASLVNGAVESFGTAAAVELLPGLRINVVSPAVLQESRPSYGPYFRGTEPVSAKRVALAYSRSVEGAQTGKVYRVE